MMVSHEVCLTSISGPLSPEIPNPFGLAALCSPLYANPFGLACVSDGRRFMYRQNVQVLMNIYDFHFQLYQHNFYVIFFFVANLFVKSL